MTVTWDHRSLTEQCLGPSLRNTGYEFEFLTCDNGSSDGVADYMASLSPVFQRRNDSNIGYAPCLNQMILRTKGDFLCVLDPDIQMPNEWLRHLVECNLAIPSSGVCGIHCIMDLAPAVNMNECMIHPGEKVFGVKFFNRKVLEKVGYYTEEFVPYGLEDADYLRRSARSGFTNYYVHGLSSSHMGAGQTGQYRRLKDDSLAKHWRKFEANLIEYDRIGSYYVAPPEMLWQTV